MNYNFDIVDSEVACSDPAGTCPQAKRECEKDMITGLKEFLDIYYPAYHALQGFDALIRCEVSSIRSVKISFHKKTFSVEMSFQSKF